MQKGFAPIYLLIILIILALIGVGVYFYITRYFHQYSPGSAGGMIPAKPSDYILQSSNSAQSNHNYSPSPLPSFVFAVTANPTTTPSDLVTRINNFPLYLGAVFIETRYYPPCQ